MRDASRYWKRHVSGLAHQASECSSYLGHCTNDLDRNFSSCAYIEGLDDFAESTLTEKLE